MEYSNLHLSVNLVQFQPKKHGLMPSWRRNVLHIYIVLIQRTQQHWHTRHFLQNTPPISLETDHS